MFYIGCAAYNLGTGYGKSAFEMIAAFERACGKVADPWSCLPLLTLHVACSNLDAWTLTNTFCFIFQKIDVKLFPIPPDAIVLSCPPEL